MARAPYPSDLSDTEWIILEPLIPPVKTGGRHRTVDMREVVNGSFYLLRSGCAWRMLPHEFPPWQTVYGYFRHWRNEGIWEQRNDALRQAVRLEAGRNAEPSAVIIDSQSVKTTETKGERGYDRHKNVEGYSGQPMIDWVWTLTGWILEVVKRSDDAAGFVVLPRRWVVERTFAWLGRYRRLSKD